MDYIGLVTKAWSMREQGLMTVYEYDLYSYLIHRCYMLNNKNPFHQSTEILCAVLGITRNALMLRRRKLQNMGLITFKKGRTNMHPPAYFLCVADCEIGERLPDAKGQDVEPSFVRPTLAELEVYCKERGNGLNTKRFFDYYEARNWMVGKDKMSDWQAAVRSWEKKEKGYRHNFTNYDKAKKHVRF